MADGKITVLVENTAGGRGLLAEHGLSFWLEFGNRKILFDTGQGGVLEGNARRLNIPLDHVDAIALSHGHYDHTGGLGGVLGSAPQVPVYAHPAAFRAKYARNADGSARYIGVQELVTQAIHGQAVVRSVEGPTEIGGGLHLTGPVPRTTAFEDTGGAFFMDPECREPDDLLDDQAAFLETSAGMVVILGCAHSGVINTLRYVRKLTGNCTIHTVMGGMHLLHANPERMDRTVAELRHLNVQRLLPCHCTGFPAMARLWHEFPGICTTCPVGTVVGVT